MAKSKRDRPTLKQEFFESDDLEVTSFFRRKFNLYNDTINKRTNGRATEKKELKHKAQLEAEKEYLKTSKQKRKTVFKNIDEAHLTILQDLAKLVINKEGLEVRINKKTKKQELQTVPKVLSVDTMMSVAKHFRLEKGQTTDNIGDGKNDPLRDRLNEIQSRKPNATK